MKEDVLAGGSQVEAEPFGVPGFTGYITRIPGGAEHQACPHAPVPQMTRHGAAPRAAVPAAARTPAAWPARGARSGSSTVIASTRLGSARHTAAMGVPAHH